MSKRRPTTTHRLPEIRQAELLAVPESRSPRPQVERVRFDTGDRARLFVGPVALDKYLTTEGLSWVLQLAALLEELDWTSFEATYKPGGRPPLHPRLVMGLILYGMMLKQSSLRQLEALSRRDVGAWWLSGGLTPDFTTFTKFIKRHRDVLSDDFFVKTTWLIVKRLKLGKRGVVGIDGTVMQAAASTAAALKKEALAEELEDATEAGDTPAVEKLTRARDVMEERREKREDAGKSPDTVVVSPHEPDAVLLPKKNSNDFQLAYKPTVATHSSGLIVGQALSPTSEPECVRALLEQHQQVFDAQPELVLADSGFHSVEVLALFVRLDIDALVPSGKGTKEKKTKASLFPRSEFAWDEEANAPRCPAGRLMSGGHTPQKDRRGAEYRQFQGRGCRTCTLRDRCTRNAPRRLKVYEGDDLKRAMAEALSHPAAKKAYRARAGIVEPSIARLREGGLVRFRKRGTANVRVEFSLHCVAHNLRMLFWGGGRRFVVAAAVVLPDGRWCVVIAGGELTQA